MSNGNEAREPVRVDFVFNGYNRNHVPFNVTHLVMEIAASYEELDRFEECKCLTDVVLPDDLAEIGNGMFSGCCALKRINFPSALREIGFNAFQGTALTSLVLPEGLERVGDYAFAKCIKLKSVTFTSRTTKVAASAFYGCLNLVWVDLPEDLQVLDLDVFGGCKSLVSIREPSKLTEIADATTFARGAAFNWCTSLLSAELPKCCNYVGSHAFIHCKSLVNISLSATPEE